MEYNSSSLRVLSATAKITHPQIDEPPKKIYNSLNKRENVYKR